MTRTPPLQPASILEPTAWRRAILIVPIAFAAAMLVHVVVLQGFPNSGDEYAYLWQANAFAAGEVTADSPQPAAAFVLNHIGDVNNKRFSKYPPGWPLLLAVGVLVGLPGVINPLLAALALAGIYRLGCSWVGPRAAMFGVMVTGASPFFLLNAASYHSHPSCLLAITALAVALTWASERPGAGPLLAAGASFALAVLIRPYTAFLLGVPLLVAFAPTILSASGSPQPIGRFDRVGKVLWFVAGGVPGALWLLAIDHAVTGSIWTLPWTYFDPTEKLGFGPYGHTFLKGLRIAVRLSLEGVLYTSFFGVILVAVARTRVFHGRLLWVLLLAPIVGYVFWWSDGGNRYGPRFYYEALISFTLLAGVGVERLSSMRRFPVMAIISVCATVLVFGVLSLRISRQISARRDVYKTVSAAGLHDAVVLLTTGSGDMVRIDLTRNPPDTRHASVLFALSRGASDREIKAAYPDRALYWYRFTPGGGAVWPARIE